MLNPFHRFAHAAAGGASGQQTRRLALVTTPCSCASATPRLMPGLRPKSSALTISLRVDLIRASQGAGCLMETTDTETAKTELAMSQASVQGPSARLGTSLGSPGV